MLHKKLVAIVYFFKDVMPRNDWETFSHAMKQYERLAEQDAMVYPDPNTGNANMDALIQAIVESLEEEDGNATAQAAGVDVSQYNGDVELHAGGQKRAGCTRFGCGYNYFYPYWNYPWWWQYWYRRWTPYYWWRATPIVYY